MEISDKEVYKLAKEIYETEHKNEFMPEWENCPSIYARGCLTDAYNRLKNDSKRTS